MISDRANEHPGEKDAAPFGVAETRQTTVFFVWSVACAALLVCATALLLLSAFGVRLGEIARYTGYELVFVLAPGCLGLAALRGLPIRAPGGWLRWITTGWALGYLLEILAYTLASASGARTWFAAYPLLMALCLYPLIWRQCGWPASENSENVVASRPDVTPATAWLLGGVCSIVLVYLSIGYFAPYPLPQQLGSGSYSNDTVWDMGLVAEAGQHWPITDPNVSGEPLHYYLFAYTHMAAVHQVTGLSLPLITLRLYIMPLLALLTLQLYALGASLAGDARAALLTPALALLIGELNPLAQQRMPFYFPFAADVYFGSTFLLGLIFFVPLLMVLAERLQAGAGLRSDRRQWALMALLLIGCGGSKGAVLPVVVGGLGLFLIWEIGTKRHITAAIATTIVMTLVMFACFYAAYAQGKTASAFAPLAIVRRMSWYTYDRAPFVHLHLLPLYVILSAACAFIGFMGIRLVGMLCLWRWKRAKLSSSEALLVCVFLAGLLAYFAFDLPGEGELYFIFYGYVAACALAAQGLSLWWQHREETLLFRSRAALALLGVLVVVVQLDTPFDGMAQRWRARQPLVVRPLTRNLTPGLLAGMEWVRRHTGPDEVVAVNNFYDGANRADPRYFYYAAFTQRRVFLEGWAYTERAVRLGQRQVQAGVVLPFPERLALCRRVFGQNDPAALDIMRRRYGVTCLLVDKVHGDASPALATLARPVYASADMDVYSVPAVKP